MSALRTIRQRGLAGFGALLLTGIAAPAHAVTFGESATLLVPGVSSPSVSGLTAAAIDLFGGFAYFGSSDAVASVAQIDLSTFLPINVFATTGPLTTASIDFYGDFSYFSSSGPASFVVNQIPDFFGVQTSTRTPAIGTAGASVIDTTTGYMYVGTRGSAPSIVRFSIPLLDSTTILALPSPAGDVTSAVIDPEHQFAYFGSSGTSAITQVNLATFKIVKKLAMPAGFGALTCAVIDPYNGYAYFGSDNIPGRIAKIRLVDFSLQGTLTLNSGENQLVSAVIDVFADRSYFGTADSPGKIVQIINSGLIETQAVTMATGENNLTSAVLDWVNEYAYFGTDTIPGKILQIDLLAGPASITLQPSSQQVQIGSDATYTVAAIGRQLSYQWALNGVPIARATGTSVTLQHVTLDQNGNTVSCLVSNPFGTVASVSALLSVNPDSRVYPNPWRADLHSGTPITFDALPSGAIVRLYTLSMHWVKTVNETGGVATWDRTNDAGQGVASGYYFYRITTSDSHQTVTGKIAIIK